MRNRLLLFVLATALLFTGACSKDEVNKTPVPCTGPTADVSIAQSYLTGEWNWVQTKTSGRGGDVITTPGQTGENMRYVFKSGSAAEFYLNNALKERYNFRLSTSSVANQVTLRLDGVGTSTSQIYALEICGSNMTLINTQTSITETHTYAKK